VCVSVGARAHVCGTNTHVCEMR